MAKSGVSLLAQFELNENNCWCYIGSKATGGYGQKTIRGRSASVHVHMWERIHGPVPEGFELDHLCKQRNCMNPAHLELVTHQENCFRKSTRRVEMRADFRNGASINEIAARFGISRKEELFEQEKDAYTSDLQRSFAGSY